MNPYGSGCCIDLDFVHRRIGPVDSQGTERQQGKPVTVQETGPPTTASGPGRGQAQRRAVGRLRPGTDPAAGTAGESWPRPSAASPRPSPPPFAPLPRMPRPCAKWWRPDGFGCRSGVEGSAAGCAIVEVIFPLTSCMAPKTGRSGMPGMRASVRGPRRDAYRRPVPHSVPSTRSICLPSPPTHQGPSNLSASSDLSDNQGSRPATPRLSPGVCAPVAPPLHRPQFSEHVIRPVRKDSHV